ncbi:hypothetical protein ACOKFD_01920 [Flagellimonas sp. S174]|uniref:Uncharacterized protein n=1 Tax=Flagellimonas meridianipacifica TaxID=1080225 RepID=A0A2T0MCJ5_9FLAO|nr:hypothetical protein [Allomuricauda pacifica]PRX55216.1 hypothetical protein CLV81_3625 [Allomuricauda pacifica]
MKKSLSTDISRIEENKKIQKMFDVYNKEVIAIVIFFVIQFVLWFSMI